MRFKFFFIFLLVVLGTSLGVAFFNRSPRLIPTEVISKKLIEKKDLKSDKWPEVIEFDNKLVKINYTFDDNLTNYIKKLLKKFNSDYSAVVVIDNSNGEILSAIDYTKDGQRFGHELVFSNTNPAASLIKVITSALLLENTLTSPDSLFHYRGKSTTLYKYQLTDKITKWSRYKTLKNAFAQSNNVIFGKLAMNKLISVNLFKMASKFGFNQKVLDELDLNQPLFIMPNSQYEMAQLASGLTTDTFTGPIHAAMMASIVANEGRVNRAKIIKSIGYKDKILWEPKQEVKQIFFKESTAGYLKELMTSTVNQGTARRYFAKFLNRGPFKHLEIGGKTGSMTGGVPLGKRDWFIAYATPKAHINEGISLSVMVVNKKKWYVRATNLAKNIIGYYYKSINPIAKR